MIADAIAGLIGSVLDRVWPDPRQKAAAALAIAEMQQAGEFKVIDAQLSIALAQAATNTAEASSGDPFASRWRPFIGWVCGAAFAWNFALLPMAVFFCAVAGSPVELKPADMGEMMPVLLGMLGLGGLRTAERLKGVAAGQ